MAAVATAEVVRRGSIRHRAARGAVVAPTEKAVLLQPLMLVLRELLTEGQGHQERRGKSICRQLRDSVRCGPQRWCKMLSRLNSKRLNGLAGAQPTHWPVISST